MQSSFISGPWLGRPGLWTLLRILTRLTMQRNDGAQGFLYGLPNLSILYLFEIYHACFRLAPHSQGQVEDGMIIYRACTCMPRAKKAMCVEDTLQNLTG